MTRPRYPMLYQINTRVYLSELSRRLDRKATLNDIPDADLDQFQTWGIDWIWLLSVWKTGPLSREVSRTHAEWQREFQETLPDLQKSDIAGSGFAISEYAPDRAFGGKKALAAFRKRLATRGIRLMLDFVPNHAGLDHPWAHDHPEYFISGTAADVLRAPQNYVQVETVHGPRSLAHGRDPNFPGWPDTLQFNYGNPELQQALREGLCDIAKLCDGVRCDMAMLLLPEIFERTWGIRSPPFWPRAIEAVRAQHPGFCFMAEVYWDLEATLQQQGFDYAYDKRLYDRLRQESARLVREHLWAGLEYQDRLARFLENHDEPRSATAFSAAVHRAAAVIAYFSPGLRFFHQGQFEGRRVRIPTHLGRGPHEPVNVDLQQFYDTLLSVSKRDAFRNGTWRLLDCSPAWDGNLSHEAFIAMAWTGENDDRQLVVVNYSSTAAQCYVRWPWADSPGRTWMLSDLFSTAVYDRAGDDLLQRGLYLDIGPWQYHVFECRAV